MRASVGGIFLVVQGGLRDFDEHADAQMLDIYIEQLQAENLRVLDCGYPIRLEGRV